MLINQIKCNHLDKPLEFIKNIHGDEINHLNARSVWKCPDCGKIIMRSQPYEKMDIYKSCKENSVEISIYKNYIFKVGDVVETIDGEIGHIKYICHCDGCKKRGFDELVVSWDNNPNEYYITDYQAKNNFPNFKRIGEYIFNHNKENKISKLEEDTPLTYVNKEKGLKYTVRYWNGNQFDTLTIGTDIVHKINQLIDAVNDLQEKNYSQEYNKILNEAKNWPDWKIKNYNENVATSIHAKKIEKDDNDIEWRYETGREEPEILGSGSQYFNVVTTYDEKEAFELAKTGNRTYLERTCFKDGRRIREWYDFFDNSWKKE